MNENKPAVSENKKPKSTNLILAVVAVALVLITLTIIIVVAMGDEKDKGEAIFPADGFNYVVRNNYAYVNKYTGNAKSYTVPDTVDDLVIAGISERAFAGTDVEIIALGKNLTDIGAYAFEDCTGLKGITGSAVTEIGNNAFDGATALQNVELGGKITAIGAAAFKDCAKLSEFIFPEGLKTLGIGAFENCSSIAAISLPGTLAEISAKAFRGCDQLEEVVINGNNLTTIGDYAFYDCRLDLFTTRALYDSNASAAVNTISDKVKIIGEYAFSKTNLRDLVLPDSVEEIRNYAFDDSDLTKITLNDSLKTIGVGAFRASNSLRNVGVMRGGEFINTLPASLTTLSELTFAECNLNKLIVPKTVTEMRGGVFAHCENMTELTFESGEWAYDETDKTIISKDGKVFYAYLFNKYPGDEERIEIYDLPAGVEEISEYAFYEAHVNTIFASSSVKKVNARAFYKSELVKFNIDAADCEIDENAFIELEQPQAGDIGDNEPNYQYFNNNGVILISRADGNIEEFKSNKYVTSWYERNDNTL